MIYLSDLHKTYGNNDVLKGVNLDISNGGVFTILGPNGSGKTTLIKCILGMVLPTKGSVGVLNENIRNNWNYRKQINYLPQIANFPANLKVSELLSMIKDLRESNVDDLELIKVLKLNSFLSSKLGALSGGTKQKVNLLLTFMFDCPIIILDEPTSGLDPISQMRLKEIIKNEKAKGKIILITSHVMSFVEEISDEIVFLLEGKIYFKGTIDELKQTTEQNDFEHAIASILNGHNV